MQNIFWIVIRTLVAPYVAYLVLRETQLGEQGALLIIGIALAVVTLISIAMTAIKILGNTLMLRGKKVLILIFTIVFQIIVLLFIWGRYFSEYTNLL